MRESQLALAALASPPADSSSLSDVTHSDTLARLERWYHPECNGDWEHNYGIEIETLDNPGWRIKISLSETGLESQPFDRMKLERSESDWLHAWVEGDRWHAAAGPLNLIEALNTFLAWASEPFRSSHLDAPPSAE